MDDLIKPKNDIECIHQGFNSLKNKHPSMTLLQRIEEELSLDIGDIPEDKLTPPVKCTA